MSSIQRVGQEKGIVDIAVAASLWSKFYVNALMPAILPAMTLLGIGLDASLENVSLVLKDDVPQAILLHRLENAVIYPPRFGEANSEDQPTVSSLLDLYAFVLTSLFEHLNWLSDRVNALTRLPRSVVWGNTGNICDFVFQELGRCLEQQTNSQADRTFIFDTPHRFARAGRNPLYRTMIRASADQLQGGSSRSIRRICCLLFKIPGDGGYCGNCPFPHYSYQLQTEQREE
jgi:siderophore-iron reductase FhuF